MRREDVLKLPSMPAAGSSYPAGGLYLGMSTFCIIAAFTPEWRRVAVIWAVFFAYSLAIGRILSLILDGMPSPILLF
jgi:hypothetical protein